MQYSTVSGNHHIMVNVTNRCIDQLLSAKHLTLEENWDANDYVSSKEIEAYIQLNLQIIITHCLK